LRNQLKVLYRFDRGVALGSCFYYLKNPFDVLETLANNARCFSTRVGARSVAATVIREEPIAYLLDNREANDDPENFWGGSHHAYFPWRREPVGGRSAGVSLGLPDGLQPGGG
jgi:hypothetical protein